MKDSSFIEKLGFERAIDVNLHSKLTDANTETLEQVKDFKIDKIYFCKDDNANSYPAVFIKQIISFDNKNLKQIAQIHHKVWNYKKVLFLYVYTDTEIRIYNCASKPIAESPNTDYKKELKNIELKIAKVSDKAMLKELTDIFSSIAIDTGIIWTLKEAKTVRDKINIQRKVDKFLVESLFRTSKELQEQGLELALIHKLMMRSLFLLYLEDRGATDAKFYSQFKIDAKTYFEILEDVEATYKLFEKLAKRFNGSLFALTENEIRLNREQLQLIKTCFICGNDGTKQVNLFPDWRLFNFSIIQIELLSEIYENFLARLDSKIKQNTGTYYTPPSLVELMLNEKLPVNNSEKRYEIKVLDPACGSGIFLVESFKRLVRRYENAHQQKLTDFDTLKDLLTKNIFGIELQEQAIKVAAFSLYLALVDKLNPKTIWQEENNKLPDLINDPNDPTIEKQGNNLFCKDSIESNREVEAIQFDLVIGNPPFGTKNLLPSIRRYCDKEGFAKEMVLPFLHKSIQFSPKGEIALIFSTKVLTNTSSTYQKFRNWLFNECYVEKVYNFSILRKAPKTFGGQLFGGATGPISIVFFQKEPPEELSNKIIYFAPKTYVKSNVLECVVIDNTDIKYLPRKECEKPDTKIWKIAMWGGMKDWELLKRLDSDKYKTISDFTREHKIKSGVGFQLLTQMKDIPKKSKELGSIPYLDAKDITRYYTPNTRLRPIIDSVKTEKAISFYKTLNKVNDLNDIDTIIDFRRKGDLTAYDSPHIIVKKGLENNSVCASLIEKKCSFRDGVYGFYADNKNKRILNALMAYFNSKLSTYYLFMTISSYGIEREQIMKNEYLSIPINIEGYQIDNICKSLEAVSQNNNSFELLSNQNTEILFIDEIDKIINNSLGLSASDILLINDSIKINVDLFHKGKNSKALLPIKNLKEYANIISTELNNFLEGQGLFANVTTYKIHHFSPLLMITISFEEHSSKLNQSSEDVCEELEKIDKLLWEEKSTNIYFRKKINYRTGDDVYIIRPNQRRFWTQTMAMEDASDLIFEILNED